MPAPMIVPLPPGLELPAGYKIRLNALSPTTGATVSGVTISAATIQVSNLAGTAASELKSGPFLLVPGAHG